MVTTNDIITERDIRALAESVNKREKRWQQAFKQMDWPEDTGSLSFPEITEEDGISEEEIGEVAEGSAYPSSSFSYSAQVLYKKKFGVALEFTQEALSDTSLPVLLNGKNEALDANAKKLDGIAGAVVRGAAVNSGVGDNNDDLSINDLIDARAWHQAESRGAGSYDPQLAFVESLGAASLLKEFASRQTAEGDETAKTGQIGEVAGLDIIEVSGGALPAHNAVLVDTRQFGWSAAEYRARVQRDDDIRTDTVTMTVSDRLNWIAVDGDAACTVKG